MQPPPPSNLEAIKEAVQELYGLGLGQISCPKFYKPYLEAIDKENPYSKGYRILEFSLFSRENGQSTLEHVARFIVHCGELANYENFPYFKLTLFPKSLIGYAFTWYATLPRNYIMRC